MGHPLHDIIAATVDERFRRWLRLTPQVLFGEITATAPLTVRLDGDDIPIEIELRDAAYTPAIGHRVRVLSLPADTARNSRARVLVLEGRVVAA